MCTSGPARRASRPAAPGDTGGTPRPLGQDVTTAHPSTPRRASRAQPGARSTRQTKTEPAHKPGPATVGQRLQKLQFYPQKSEFAHHLSTKCSISAIITLLLAACSPGGFGHGVLQRPFPIDVKGEDLTADNLISFSGIHLPTAKKGVLPPNFTPSPPPTGAAEVTPQREVSQAPSP